MHPLGGDVDLRRGHFSVKMYVKMKELGPMGGGGGGVRRARPPRSANVMGILIGNWRLYKKYCNTSFRRRKSFRLVFDRHSYFWNEINVVTRQM